MNFDPVCLATLSHGKAAAFIQFVQTNLAKRFVVTGKKTHKFPTGCSQIYRV
jgi:hypothetical protein